MIPNAWSGFDFGLGSDADMLRDTVRGFAQERIARPSSVGLWHLAVRTARKGCIRERGVTAAAVIKHVDPVRACDGSRWNSSHVRKPMVIHRNTRKAGREALKSAEQTPMPKRQTNAEVPAAQGVAMLWTRVGGWPEQSFLEERKMGQPG